MARHLKVLKIADETSINGLRPMEPKDVPTVTKLLNTYLQQFKLHIQFDEAEFGHFLLPREGVVDSYVVDEGSGITDFVSFYNLPSSVLRHPEYSTLKVAYSYYNVPGKHSMLELMSDALVLAKKKNYDVFNALDVQEN